MYEKAAYRKKSKGELVPGCATVLGQTSRW